MSYFLIDRFNPMLLCFTYGQKKLNRIKSNTKSSQPTTVCSAFIWVFTRVAVATKNNHYAVKSPSTPSGRDTHSLSLPRAKQKALNRLLAVGCCARTAERQGELSIESRPSSDMVEVNMQEQEQRRRQPFQWFQPSEANSQVPYSGIVQMRG